MIRNYVKERFLLDLEDNFVEKMRIFLKERDSEITDRESLHKIILILTDSKQLCLLTLKKLLSSMRHTTRKDLKIRLTGAPLRTGELISLTFSDFKMINVLQAYFNQYNPNNLYRSAWTYLSDTQTERHGVLLIEHNRGLEKDLIEFCSFLNDLKDDQIKQYTHVITATEEKHRRDVMIEGFVGFGQIMEAIAGQEIRLSADRVEALFEAIVQPIYESFHRKLVSRATESSIRVLNPDDKKAT